MYKLCLANAVKSIAHQYNQTNHHRSIVHLTQQKRWNGINHSVEFQTCFKQRFRFHRYTLLKIKHLYDSVWQQQSTDGKPIRIQSNCNKSCGFFSPVSFQGKLGREMTGRERERERETNKQKNPAAVKIEWSAKGGERGVGHRYMSVVTMAPGSVRYPRVLHCTPAWRKPEVPRQHRTAGRPCLSPRSGTSETQRQSFGFKPCHNNCVCFERELCANCSQTVHEHFTY